MGGIHQALLQSPMKGHLPFNSTQFSTKCKQAMHPFSQVIGLVYARSLKVSCVQVQSFTQHSHHLFEIVLKKTEPDIHDTSERLTLGKEDMTCLFSFWDSIASPRVFMKYITTLIKGMPGCSDIKNNTTATKTAYIKWTN